MEEKKTNTMAIIGFIASFFVPLVGLVLSIVGLNKVKECNDGKGLSIAGIVISSLYLAIQIFAIVLLFLFGFYITEVDNNPDFNDSVNNFIENIDVDDLESYYTTFK